MNGCSRERTSTPTLYSLTLGQTKNSRSQRGAWVDRGRTQEAVEGAGKADKWQYHSGTCVNRNAARETGHSPGAIPVLFSYLDLN